MGAVDDVPDYESDTPSDPLLAPVPHGEIDMRIEFEEIQRTHGHFVVLRRLERTVQRLPNYDELYDDSHRDTLRRMFQGRTYTDHLILSRKRTVVPSFDQQHPAGIVSSPGLFFYLSYISKPTREDWILELALDDAGQPIKPFQVVHYYTIMDVDEDRDIKGKMAYFRLRVEERSTGGHQ